MIKRLILFVCACLAVMMLVSCTETMEDISSNKLNSQEDTSSDEMYFLEDAPLVEFNFLDEYAVAYTEMAEYQVGTEEITVIYENQTEDEDATRGGPSLIEYFTNGEWKTLARKEYPPRILVSYHFPPNTLIRYEFDLTVFKSELIPGKYRVIVTGISINDINGVLAAEFTVVE